MIIIVDDKALTAIDISDEQNNYISINGQNKLLCIGASTAEKFSTFLIDYYNLEKFSDFNDKVLLINCGNDDMVIKGFESFFSLSNAKLNIISKDDAAKLILNQLIKDDSLKIKKYGINLFDINYSYDKDMELIKKKFNLMGYSIDIAELIKIVKEEM